MEKPELLRAVLFHKYVYFYTLQLVRFWINSSCKIFHMKGDVKNICFISILILSQGIKLKLLRGPH